MREMDVRQEQQDDDEIVIDLGKLFTDIWKGIKKFWWLVLLLAVIGACAMCLQKKRSYHPMYEASASFTVKTMAGATNNETNTTYNFYYDKNTADQLGKTFPYILNSDILTEKLKEELGTESINGSINASSVPDSNLFTLTVLSSDRREALKILNAVIEVYPEVSQYVIGETQFQMVEEPEMSKSPVNRPHYKKALVYGAGGGMMLGCLWILLYALTRKTIRQPEDLKNILNTTCLATLPEQKKIQKKNQVEEVVSILSENADPGFSESMWSLENRVENIMKKHNHKVLMVTSTSPSEGKSTVSLNLALAMAQRGRKVLLIDGDLRKPDLKERLKINENLASIKDVLKGQASLEDALCYLEEEKVMFLGSNQEITNPDKVIGSEAMSKLMRKLRGWAEIIILDAPPCGMMADASMYWKHVDSVLYVVRQDWAQTNRIVDSIQELPENGEKLAGCVLNRMKTGFASYGYGHYGRYGYGRYGYGRYGKYGYGHDGKRSGSYGRYDSEGDE